MIICSYLCKSPVYFFPFLCLVNNSHSFTIILLTPNSIYLWIHKSLLFFLFRLSCNRSIFHWSTLSNTDSFVRRISVYLSKSDLFIFSLFPFLLPSLHPPASLLILSFSSSLFLISLVSFIFLSVWGSEKGERIIFIWKEERGISC